MLISCVIFIHRTIYMGKTWINLQVFFTSSRGGRKLAFEGFTYNKDKQDSKSGKTYWNVIFNSAKVE